MFFTGKYSVVYDLLLELVVHNSSSCDLTQPIFAPFLMFWIPRPEGGTPYNGLYGEAERGTSLFRLQVYKRVGISQV